MMKKVMMAMVVSSSVLFANSVNVSEVLKKVNMLEQRVTHNETEIANLKKELKIKSKIIKENAKTQQQQNIFATNKCDYITASNLKYQYEDGIIPAYNLTFDLKNGYDYDIKYVNGDLEAYDKDKVKILDFNLMRNVNMKSKSDKSIKAHHTIDDDLEYYLKDENPKNLTLKFKVRKIIFQNGKELDCE